MSQALADTSVFIARESGRPLEVRSLPDELAISVVTVAELRAGVLAATEVDVRDRRLSTLTAALQFEPVPIDVHVGEQWARLRIALRDGGLRMPVNDSWIAATAIALGVPVVTQDDDFPELPGLRVVKVLRARRRGRTAPCDPFFDALVRACGLPASAADLAALGVELAGHLTAEEADRRESRQGR